MQSSTSTAIKYSIEKAAASGHTMELSRSTQRRRHGHGQQADPLQSVDSHGHASCVPGEVLERVLAHLPFRKRCGQYWTAIPASLASFFHASLDCIHCVSAYATG